MPAAFDATRFLKERWGDPDRLLAFLHQYGHPEMQRPTVNQWFRRNRIPPEWFATLVALAEIENGPVSVAKYLS